VSRWFRAVIKDESLASDARILNAIVAMKRVDDVA